MPTLPIIIPQQQQSVLIFFFLLFFLQGLICYSEIGTGSCRNADPGRYGFHLTNPGGAYICDPSKGQGIILDKFSCGEAMRALPRFGKRDPETGAMRYPDIESDSFRYPGCGYRNTGVGLSHNGRLSDQSSTYKCAGSAGDKGCLCRSAPKCTHTDGTVENEQGPCLCGIVACDQNSGFYCDADTNTCSSGEPCAHGDGVTQNSIGCLCGTVEGSGSNTSPEVACNRVKGLYCLADKKHCAMEPITACEFTDGSEANAKDCVCGDVVCSSKLQMKFLSDTTRKRAQGLVCYSTLGPGSCRQSITGNYLSTVLTLVVAVDIDITDSLTRSRSIRMAAGLWQSNMCRRRGCTCNTQPRHVQ